MDREEPGGLQSMGHRVKHDGSGLAHTHIHTNHSVGPFFGCQFDLGSFRRIFFDVDLLDVSR